MTHTIARPFRPRLDPGRIAAETGTIAVNVVLLMVLMAPLSPPAPRVEDRKAPDVTIIEPVPLTPVEPIRVPVVHPPKTEPKPETPRPAQRQETVVQDPPVAVEHGELPAVVPVFPPDRGESVGPTGGDVAGNDGPMAGAQLRYAAAPPPPYPREALREGLAGSVLLEVLVDVDGRPLRVDVARSSGHRVLDLAAKRQVQSRWRFVPATRDGRPVQAIGMVPVEFTLER